MSLFAENADVKEKFYSFKNHAIEDLNKKRGKHYDNYCNPLFIVYCTNNKFRKTYFSHAKAIFFIKFLAFALFQTFNLIFLQCTILHQVYWWEKVLFCAFFRNCTSKRYWGFSKRHFNMTTMFMNFLHKNNFVTSFIIIIIQF